MMEHRRRSILIILLLSLALACPVSAEESPSRLVQWLNGFYGLSLEDDSSAWVQHSLGSDENSQVRLTIHEGVYDGVMAWVLLTVEPVEEDAIDISNIEIDVDNAPAATSTCQIVEEGDALTLCAEICLNGQAPEQASLRVGVDAQQPCSVSFKLNRTESTWTALSPESGANCDATVLFANRVDTPFATYLTYAYSLRDAILNRSVALIEEDESYYATEYGQYIHLDPNCSGMEGASEISGREAIEQEKLPCPVCAVMEAGPLQDFMVSSSSLIEGSETYYATEYGKYIHLDPECSGMKGASAISGDEAIAQSRIPCPICVTMDEDWAESERFLTLVPLDAQCQPVNGVLWSEEGAPAEGEEFTFSSVYMFLKDTLPTDTLFLAPSNATEDQSSFIKLTTGT